MGMMMTTMMMAAKKQDYGCNYNKIITEEKVPKKGYFVVYVGEEGRSLQRFVVPLSYLKSSIFMDMLDQASEEYGSFQNGIVLPCDVLTFLRVTSSLSKKGHHHLTSWLAFN